MLEMNIIFEKHTFQTVLELTSRYSFDIGYCTNICHLSLSHRICPGRILLNRRIAHDSRHSCFHSTQRQKKTKCLVTKEIINTSANLVS